MKQKNNSYISIYTDKNDKHSAENTYNIITNKYKCPYCNREFNTWKSMLGHQAKHFRMHEVDQNISALQMRVCNNIYKCDLCDKTFKSKIALKAHQYKHKEKQYEKCLYCKKDFCKSHIKSHIKAEVEKIKKFDNLIENVDYIRCPICNIPKLHLKRHIISEHNISFAEFKSRFPDALISAPTVEQKARESYNKKYGIASRGAAFPHNKINKIEQIINQITDKYVIYADRLIWYSKKENNKYIIHTPDFIIVKPNLIDKYLNIKNNNKCITDEYLRLNILGIIEVFGNYWHSNKFTGISNKQHEQNIINFYKFFHKPCLILWEYEIKNNIEIIKKRINNFINTLKL